MRYLLIAVLFLSCGQQDITVINGSLSDSDRNLVQAQINKANEIGARHNLAPVTKIRLEVMKRDTRCIDRTAFSIVEQVAPGTNYDGSEYDLDREVNGLLEMCVAGRFFPPNHIQTTLEGIRAGYGVWFEMEHMLLYGSNRERYEQTKYHSTENIHPILR